MGTTRTTLEQIGGNLDESLGVRRVDARPQLSPVPNSKDIGRRALRNYGKVEINQVIPDPEQPRAGFSEEATDRLAQSIQDKGQLLPIRVRWAQELEKWVIISGERRWRATLKARLPTIDCYFHDGDLVPSEILEQQLIENLLLEDLSPLEEAQAYRSLMGLNRWNGKQVAEALRIPASTVSRGLALLELPTAIQQQLAEGKITARAAYELSKLANAEVQHRLAQRAAGGQLSTEELAKAVRQRKGQRPSPPRGTRQVFVSDPHWKVTVTSPQIGNYHDIEQALQQALDEVRHRILNGLQLF